MRQASLKCQDVLQVDFPDQFFLLFESKDLRGPTLLGGHLREIITDLRVVVLDLVFFHRRKWKA
jgi:hypothetical protein